MSKVFVDSNVWVYLFTDEDNSKGRKAREFLSSAAGKHDLAVSYQVFNEVCCVLKKKGYSEHDIRRVTNYLADSCEICCFSVGIALSASELREEHSFSYWDGLIIAAALELRSDMLVTEDMQDGRKIGGLTIRNIFAGLNDK